MPPPAFGGCCCHPLCGGGGCCCGGYAKYCCCCGGGGRCRSGSPIMALNSPLSLSSLSLQGMSGCRVTYLFQSKYQILACDDFSNFIARGLMFRSCRRQESNRQNGCLLAAETQTIWHERMEDVFSIHRLGISIKEYYMPQVQKPLGMSLKRAKMGNLSGGLPVGRRLHDVCPSQPLSAQRAHWPAVLARMGYGDECTYQGPRRNDMFFQHV